MTPIRMMLTSDVHLDVHFRFQNPERALERSNDINHNFETIVNSALVEKPDLFLISGDVFDRPTPSNYSRVFLTEKIRALNDAGIKIFLIAGNHEISRQSAKAQLAIDTLRSSGIASVFSGSENIKTTILNLHGTKVCIAGKSYNGLNEGANPLKNEDFRLDGDLNILMLHASLKGLGVMPDYPEMADSNPFSPEDIPKELDLLALGHFHKQFDRIHNGTLICNPGSLERLRWDEVEQNKGYYLIEFQDDKPKFEFRTLPTRPMGRYEMEVDGKDEQLLSLQILRCLEKFADPKKIFKLTIGGTIPQNRFSEIRYDMIYEKSANMFFNLELDTSKLVPEGLTPFSIADVDEPLMAYTKHMQELESKEASKNAKELLAEAREVGRRYLMEAVTD